MSALKEVIFSITNRCNLRCRMCDIPGGKTEELTTEEWQKVIKDASRLGAQTIVFSGGEPLLREDIFKLISFARGNNLNACVTSNGHLIDERVARELKSSGVNVVNISVEGSKETHDYLRGPGGFEKALGALDNLRKHKIESTVASTVSKYNYKDLLYILEIAKTYGATTVRLQPFNAIFLKDHQRKNEFLIKRQDVQKVEEIIRDFISLSRKYGIAVNPAGYLLRIPVYLSGKNFYPDNCSALWYSCPINPNGDFFPCWIEGSRNKLIGNVKTEGLYELWLSEKRIKMIGSIINNGCKGCLMSCYDEAFDHKALSESMVYSVKKIKKFANYKKLANKILQYFKGQATRFRLRYRFYVSYNGPLSKVFARRVMGYFGKVRRLKQDRRLGKENVLSGVMRSKNKIKKEIRAL